MLKDRVLKSEYAPNCYILASFPKREDSFGEVLLESTVSFLYDKGEWAVEWEPNYGPIQVWHRCEADAVDAREHYYYDYTDSSWGNWSQLAVAEYRLREAAHTGKFAYIFAVLADWADSYSCTGEESDV